MRTHTLELTRQQLEDLEHHILASEEDYRHALKTGAFDDSEGHALAMENISARSTELLDVITKALPPRFTIENNYPTVCAHYTPRVVDLPGTAVAFYAGLMATARSGQSVDLLCQDVLGILVTDLYTYLGNIAKPISMLYQQVEKDWPAMAIWQYHVEENVGAWVARFAIDHQRLPQVDEVYACAVAQVRHLEGDKDTR